MILKVLRVNPEDKDVFSVILEKPSGFSFYAGQYLNVELAGDTRDFTISSSPTERFLMITTKKSASKFKKTMAKIKTRDTITTSHPVGTFILDENSPAVFIAGGIGITPFRSMLKYAVDQKLPTLITLIYSNSTKDFLFKNVLEEWKEKLPKFTIIYHNSSQHGRLDKTKMPTIVGKTVNAIFYLAGAPSFVDDMEKILLELEVEEVNVRYDRFDGYI